MHAPAIESEREPPSMFNGWILDMQIIADGSAAIREHKMHACVQEMQKCFDERKIAALKAAIDSTESAATDLQLALSVLRGNIRRFEHVIAVHLARKPRV